MEQQNLNGYIKSVIDISFLTNKFINDMEPWALKKKDVKRMNTVLFISRSAAQILSSEFRILGPNTLKNEAKNPGEFSLLSGKFEMDCDLKEGTGFVVFVLLEDVNSWVF